MPNQVLVYNREQQRIVRQRQLFAVLYAFSGVAGLAYEVTWSRFLTLQMGHSVAAASAVLAAFMAGLAVGAWIAGRVSVPVPRRLKAYAILEISIAVIALGLPASLHGFLPVLRWAYSNGDASVQFALVRLAISFALLALPAAAMGATFPLVAAWFTSFASATKPNIFGKSAADVGLLMRRTAAELR